MDIYVQGRALTGGRMKGLNERPEAFMTVAKLNVRGLNDAKISLVPHKFIAEEWDIPAIIDTRLDTKEGD